MRESQLAVTVRKLLEVEDPVTYRGFKAQADNGLLPDLAKIDLQNEFIVRMWQRAEADDWAFWADRLDVNGPLVGAPYVDPLLARLFSESAAVDEEIQERLPQLAEALASVREIEAEATSEHPALNALEDALRSPPWGADHESRIRAERLHGAAQKLRPLGDGANRKVEEILCQNLIATLKEPMGGPGQLNTYEVLQGVEQMAEAMERDSIDRIAKAVQEFDVNADPESATAEVSARSTLAQLARDRGLDVSEDAYKVSTSKVLAIINARTGGWETAVARYVELGKPFYSIRRVINAIGRSLPETVKGGLRIWASRVSLAQRTALARELINVPGRRVAALSAIGPAGVNETKISGQLRQAIVEAGNEDARRRLVAEAKALELRTQNAGHVLSDAGCQLLKSGRKSDISVAALLVEAIPEGQVKTKLLGAAFKSACEDLDYKLTEAEATTLYNAGIPLTEKMVKKGIREKVSDFFKGK